MSWNRDLTLDEALADPMIGAALRADGVDPRAFELLLRSTAQRLDSQRPGARWPDTRRGPASRPGASLAARACRPVAGECCAW